MVFNTKKQEAEVSENSLALQAGRDLNIGCSSKDVIEIYNSLFKKDIEILFLKSTRLIQQKFEEFIKKIDTEFNKYENMKEKLSTPSGQNDFINAAKAYVIEDDEEISEAIIKTISLKLKEDDKTIISVASKTAIPLFSQITKNQINILSCYLSVINIKYTSNDINYILSEINKLLKLLFPYSIKYYDLSHLRTLGIVNLETLLTNGKFIERIIKTYKDIFPINNTNEQNKSIILQYEYIKQAAEIWDNEKIEQIRLTPVAIIIAHSNMEAQHIASDISLQAFMDEIICPPKPSS